MKSKAQVVKESKSLTKVKKAKQPWTKESASDFVKKNTIKGLRYWSASDYLMKVHNINTEV